MFRRYAIPCSLVLVGALAVALTVYAATPVNYQSSCVFRVGQPTFAFTGTDAMVTAQRVAATEVARSAQGPAFAAAAKSLGGVSAGTLKTETTLLPPVGEQTDYTVTVQDADAANAQRYADATCDGFVSDVAQRRDADIKAYAASLEQKIASLRQEMAGIEAKPKDQLTQIDQVTAASDQAAAVQLGKQLAGTLAEAPELTDVVNSASVAAKTDNRNLGRDLLIGLVAGVLAGFVIILVGEMVIDRQRDLQLRGLIAPAASVVDRRSLAEK